MHISMPLFREVALTRVGAHLIDGQSSSHMMQPQLIISGLFKLRIHLCGLSACINGA